MTIEQWDEMLQDEYYKDVKIFVRWAKNGRKYIWKIDNLTKQQCVNLVNKYDIDQICDEVIWLQP